jgi:HEAT repeat protein
MPAKITVAALFALGVLVGLGALLFRASRSEDEARREAQLAELAVRIGLLEKSLQTTGGAPVRTGRAERAAAQAPTEEGAQDPESKESEEGEEGLAELESELATLAERVRGLEEDPLRRAYAFIASDSEELRREGIRALRRVGRFDPEARLAMRQLLNDPNSRVRLEALQALGEVRDKEAVPRMTEMLADNDPAIRRQAIRSLSECEAGEAAPSIAAQLGDTDARVREEAADALGELKSPAAVEGLIAALGDATQDVRGEAIASLGEIGAKSAVPALRALYEQDPGPHARRLILALRALGDEQPFRREVERLSQQALGGEDEKRRLEAMEDLARLAGRESREVFTRALEDPSPQIREMANRFLRR